MLQKILVMWLVILTLFSCTNIYLLTKMPKSMEKEIIIQTSAINVPPVAEANNDVIIWFNDTVHFSAEGSYDPDGEIASYTWIFGDGNTAYGKEVEHKFLMDPSLWKENVTLIVEDNNGTIDADYCIVYLNFPPYFCFEQVDNTSLIRFNWVTPPYPKGNLSLDGDYFIYTYGLGGSCGQPIELTRDFYNDTDNDGNISVGDTIDVLKALSYVGTPEFPANITVKIKGASEIYSPWVNQHNWCSHDPDTSLSEFTVYVEQPAD